MSEYSTTIALQVALSLGLLNVWLARARSATAYRGGEARTLCEEFETYGLPGWVFYVVGALKIGAALTLLVGIWNSSLVAPASVLIVLLMLSAIAMHIKVNDPPLKSLPALAMLAMSISLFAVVTL